MGHLMKLEFKKYKLKRYGKGVMVSIFWILVFITISLVDSMTDPEQTRDTFESTLRMINLLVSGTFLIYSSELAAKHIVGEYIDRTILILFTYPIRREKIILSKLIMLCSFTGISIFVGYLFCYIYILVAEKYFDVLKDSISLADMRYGLKELIFACVIGMILCTIPYIVGMIKKSAPTTIVTAVLVVALMQPIIGRNPGILEMIVKILVFLSLCIIGIWYTLRTKIHELG